MEFDCFCTRCQRWYEGGAQCPGCDGDPASRFCAPPAWVVPDDADDPEPT